MKQKQCTRCLFFYSLYILTVLSVLNVLSVLSCNQAAKGFFCVQSQCAHTVCLLNVFSESQLLDWHLQLDRSLPAPLDMVGAWLHEAEGALRQEIVVQQAHDVTDTTVHRALEQHKVSME